MSAYENSWYNEAIQFFKVLYGAVLKSNPNIKMGVLTGAIRVAQAGMFSDLNNLEIHTILDEDYDEYFGLLEDEVEKALNQIEEKKYETFLKRDKVKDIVKIGLVFDGKKAVAHY